MTQMPPILPNTEDPMNQDQLKKRIGGGWKLRNVWVILFVIFVLPNVLRSCANDGPAKNLATTVDVIQEEQHDRDLEEKSANDSGSSTRVNLVFLVAQDLVGLAERRKKCKESGTRWLNADIAPLH